jgi:hypothetical protein
MALGTGLDAQVGIAKETTWGTNVTPDHFLEFKSTNIKPDIQQYLAGPYLGTGRFPRRARQWVQGGGGDLEIDVMSSGAGLLFQLMLGTVATTGTGPYVHTFTPHTNGLRGISATMQIGVPAVSGTVHPFNFSGGKVLSWAMKTAIGDPLSLTTTWDFDQSFETSTALATASYGDGDPFIFADGAGTINGAAVNLTSIELDGDNGLTADRRLIGNTKLEPLANAPLMITGTLGFEFENLTREAALVAGTEIDDLILTFTQGADLLVVTIPKLIYGPDGSPEVGGPDVVSQSLAWTALSNDTDPIITIAYTTTDETP